MEGINTSKIETESNIESLSAWRELKEAAPQQASNLISEIAGFETMEADEQVEALKGLLLSLQSDNQNRFVAEAIAVQLSIIIENEKFSNRIAQLEMAV